MVIRDIRGSKIVCEWLLFLLSIFGKRLSSRTRYLFYLIIPASLLILYPPSFSFSAWNVFSSGRSVATPVVSPLNMENGVSTETLMDVKVSDTFVNPPVLESSTDPIAETEQAEFILETKDHRRIPLHLLPRWRKMTCYVSQYNMKTIFIKPQEEEKNR